MSKELRDYIFPRVAGDLEAIEQALCDNLNPYLARVREIAGHILFTGGKRIRPLLMVLCARMSEYGGTDDKRVSVMFEYLHTATLLHDDIVDGASMRRGSPAAHVVWDSPSAVLVGDFLLARSASIAVDTGKIELMKILADILEYMSQGEIHQLARKGSTDLSEEEYRTIIFHKTAVLMEGACRSGAILAGASPEKALALADYGKNLGMAFQMIDDLLDYTADTRVLGKRVGADLREGKFTLPLIHALARAGAEDAGVIKEIMGNPDVTETAFEKLKALLEAHDGIGYTRRAAENHIRSARAALAVFPLSETKTLLEKLADYTIRRDK
ncbi:MAG: polyprenyl synthetase family protein [Thermodesulfobacteriota bacterium]